MNYEENLKAFAAVISNRKHNFSETEKSIFWIQDDGTQVGIFEHIVPKSLRIENVQKLKTAFIALDGKTGCFAKSKPPVKDENPFKYQHFTNGRYESKTVGSCDCMLISSKWCFIELKTEVFTQNENQAEQQREKASLQLARTITFFRQQAQAKSIQIESPFEGVIVFPSRFPAMKSTNINRGTRFFKEFKARLIEINTDLTYMLE